MFRDFLGLIFPQTCAACEVSLARGEEEVCIQCLSDIEETGFHQYADDNELYFRFAGKVNIKGATSFWYFDKAGKIQKILNALKYQNQHKLGVFLGRQWGHILKESNFLDGIDVIVPVPLHSRKIKIRGYNQSEKIGKGLSEATGIPMNADSLVRIVHTSTQTKKGKQERWENVKEGFALQKPLKGNILLIDDVITTGATIEACIRTIQKENSSNGNISVGGIAITRKN